MTGSAVPIARLSYAEYLTLEASSPGKHELLRGEVFAMAGGTLEHSALAGAFAGELRDALRGKPCRVFTSDARIRIRATDLATYPDVSVACGHAETDPEDPDALANPVLIAEILSDSTEAYDRGAKAAHYRHLASLRDYVLVSQREKHIEVHHRNEAGVWEIHEARTGERLELRSVGVSLAVDAVYANPLEPKA